LIISPLCIIIEAIVVCCRDQWIVGKINLDVHVQFVLSAVLFCVFVDIFPALPLKMFNND